MKFFAFILSLLMVGFSVLPCADESFAGKGKVQTEISKQHNDGEDHNDTCSPFCHCTCCANFSINHVFTATSSFMPVNTMSYSSFLTGNVINHSSSVWQPPRIG